MGTLIPWWTSRYWSTATSQPNAPRVQRPRAEERAAERPHGECACVRSARPDDGQPLPPAGRRARQATVSRPRERVDRPAVDPLGTQRDLQPGGLRVPAARERAWPASRPLQRRERSPAEARRKRMGSPTTRLAAANPPAVGAALPAGELGLALLGERGEALLRVLAREQVAELLRLALERAGRELSSRFASASATGSSRRASRRPRALLEHRIGDRVDEADPQRLLRVDQAAGEDQLLRDADAADAREPLRAAPARDDAEVDLGLAEPRVARGVADVARRARARSRRRARSR